MKSDNQPLPTIKKGKYQHYKGPYYEVIDIVRHSEDNSLLILYRPLYGERNLFVRPYDMFFENVTTDGGTKERFKFIST